MPTQLLRNLLKTFQYSQCDELIGRNLLLRGKSLIQDDLSQLANALIPNEEITIVDADFDLMLGTIAKFGILEIAFPAPQILNTTSLDAASAIRELGFADQSNDPIQFDDDPEYCLRQLYEGISESSLSLQLFLTTDDEKIVDLTFFERITRVKNHEKIPFPIEFTVVDACITNSNYAWFYKHNYTLLYMINSY